MDLFINAILSIKKNLNAIKLYRNYIKLVNKNINLLRESTKTTIEVGGFRLG
jgi:hypothetical protein